MASKNWKGIAELIGIAAIVASLLFVGLQLQQDQQIAVVDTHGSLSEEKIELAVLVSQNMEIWKKGLQGEDLSDTERGRFSGLLAAVEMHHQRSFIRWRGIGPGDPDVIARRFAFALYIFPGMRAAYEADMQFIYSMDEATGGNMTIRPWKGTVLRSLEELDDANPPIPQEKSYIFWIM